MMKNPLVSMVYTQIFQRRKGLTRSTSNMCVSYNYVLLAAIRLRPGSNAGLLLAQRLRRWAKIKPTSLPRLVFARHAHWAHDVFATLNQQRHWVKSHSNVVHFRSIVHNKLFDDKLREAKKYRYIYVDNYMLNHISRVKRGKKKIQSINLFI